jgi:hypothetical protein
MQFPLLLLEGISKMLFGPTRQRQTSLCVGSLFQILDILEYAFGLKLGSAFLARRSSAGDLEEKSYF